MLYGKELCFTRPGRVIGDGVAGILPHDFSEKLTIAGDVVAVRAPSDGRNSTPGYVIVGPLDEMLKWFEETMTLLREEQAARAEKAKEKTDA